jgi:hypothetical protein
MKHVHRHPVSAAIVSRSGFDVINGTPPGPADPAIGEILAPPRERCARGWTARHCRAVSR